MIIKIRKREDPYARIDNRCLSDERLSYRARGLLAYLLSKPDNWQVRSGEVIAGGIEGRDAIRSAFKELAALGYAHLQKARRGNGKVQGSEWIITEISDRAPEKPSPGNPQHRAPEKPTVGFSGALVTKEQNSTNERVHTKSEFIDFLSEDPRFDGLDVEREMERAVEYCKKENRPATEGFLERWLLRAERPLEDDDEKVGSLAAEPYYSWEGWTEERRRAMRELWPGSQEPPERWDKVSPDVKAQIEARVKEGWP